MKFRIKALTSLVLKTAAIGLGLVYGLPVLGLTAPLWLIGITAVFAAGILNNTRFNLNLGKLIISPVIIGLNLYYLLPIIGISLSMPMIALVTAGLATLQTIIANNINIDDNNLPIWKKTLFGIHAVTVTTEVASYRTLLSSFVMTTLFPAIGNYHIALRLGTYILPAFGYIVLEYMEYNPINLATHKAFEYIFSSNYQGTKNQLQDQLGTKQENRDVPLISEKYLWSAINLATSGQWQDRLNPIVQNAQNINQGNLQPKNNQSWGDYLLDTINPLASVISR
ncbi:hypothetical protein [Rickettsiales endosymbiont of Stachyamoeba lipophora]|uniref:hypothetical protein n=1 Tax=Rickettsiales endosymbiont of Stachyamoeba lipophora TaxID=2486578 RepID=UPI000F6479B0|nr:hypothetical protein [Rickettsiales endosymbiont of Stachyamoeba lipophora]AZL15323.1 hypothetical protein EF513_01965 [Rickettsiales endosymbiont of Stachyamoeba lipophora]